VSPSFCISIADDSRVSVVRRSRARIICSTVIEPTIERRCPAKTLCTSWFIWSSCSRKRRAALEIEG
jgi:hypothetical protein